MLTVTIKNETYPTKRDLYNLINYAIGDHCLCGMFGATGMMIGNLRDMYQAMINLKKEFCKTTGRQALHIVVSIEKKDSLWVTPQMALELGYALAVSKELQGTQTVFGIHDNTDKLHIHMVVNSVSYERGIKVGISVQQAYMSIQTTLNRLLEHYRCMYDPMYKADYLKVETIDELRA